MKNNIYSLLSFFDQILLNDNTDKRIKSKLTEELQKIFKRHSSLLYFDPQRVERFTVDEVRKLDGLVTALFETDSYEIIKAILKNLHDLKNNFSDSTLKE